MNPGRLHVVRGGELALGPVVYWMSRDQRMRDNWALLYAQRMAIQSEAPLAVVFCLAPRFLDASLRPYAFMLEGLRLLASKLEEKAIPFFLLPGEPGGELPKFVRQSRCSLVVTDFSPLSINRAWKQTVSDRISVPMHEVDAHNIVPCRRASAKLEFGAYTLRPKITRMLFEYLDEFPNLRRHPVPWNGPPFRIPWSSSLASLKVDRSVPPADGVVPGEQAALRALERFLEHRLRAYDEARNDPTIEGQSGLSPYLHFGHLSAQRVALEVRRARAGQAAAVFLEELIVRRELSDNYCWHNPRYDTFEGFPAWAQKTLNEHRKDKREHLYELSQFDAAATHDELWNAAQRQMVRSGKMHGYMRMYWAKKILEWSRSPEEALAIGLYLNDRYELDGRDPNGYVGVAWSIGGVHDRAWAERPVFGKIRYMNANGCRRKFNVKAYIDTWSV